MGSVHGSKRGIVGDGCPKSRARAPRATQWLVNQLHRKLNLPRGPGGLADDSESAAAHNIIRQAEVHDVEHVEKFGAKFDGPEFAVPAVAERRVFNHGDVEIVIGGTAEGVAAERA